MISIIANMLANKRSISAVFVYTKAIRAILKAIVEDKIANFMLSNEKRNKNRSKKN